MSATQAAAYAVADFDTIAPVPCPCGSARRAFLDVPGSPLSLHRTDISRDARTHFHKRLTEVYYVLECDADAALELDGKRVPVRPGMAVMGKPKPNESLPVIAEKLGIGHYHRHVFLCIGPDCCAPEVGQAAWDELKKQLKEKSLSLSVGPNACYRTKVQCLRICSNGPIMVVYPEGTWYQGMTAERIPRFVQEHLVEGRPIHEWIFAGNPLPKP